MGGSRQRKCRICKKRPPWRYKNCPPGICKRRYHSKVWPQRPDRAKADHGPELVESDLADLLPEPWLAQDWLDEPVDGEPDLWEGLDLRKFDCGSDDAPF